MERQATQHDLGIESLQYLTQPPSAQEEIELLLPGEEEDADRPSSKDPEIGVRFQTRAPLPEGAEDDPPRDFLNREGGGSVLKLAQQDCPHCQRPGYLHDKSTLALRVELVSRELDGMYDEQRVATTRLSRLEKNVVKLENQLILQQLMIDGLRRDIGTVLDSLGRIDNADGSI